MARGVMANMAHNRSMQRFLRYLWAYPGDISGTRRRRVLLRRGRIRVVDGVVEAHSTMLHNPLTDGTLLSAGADATDASFFIPAYFLAGLYALVNGCCQVFAFDNRFEREAMEQA